MRGASAEDRADALDQAVDAIRRLGSNRESVDCLFRLDHMSRLDQLETAFSALGRRVVVSIENAARGPNTLEPPASLQVTRFAKSLVIWLAIDEFSVRAFA